MEQNTSPQNQPVIGTSPVLENDALKVTGRAVYGIDVQLPGMLYGAVLRSPHAHARIRAIDTRQAEALAGVKAVITAADLPHLQPEADLDERFEQARILAGEKVVFYGQPVAAVAAINVHVAGEALRLIQVEYEALPPVLDVDAARASGAPVLHEGLETDELGTRVPGPTNVAAHIQVLRGDLAAGFAAADLVLEREFKTATVHQGYIEPQHATAVYEVNGQVKIWCSTQGAFSVRGDVASVLKLPMASIRVFPQEVGGAFGGKNTIYLEPLAVLLSKKAGHKPVKLVMSHADVLAATGPTSASRITVKIGVRRDGRITAAQAELAYEAGAFPGSPVGSGMNVIFAPYRLENVQLDGYDVLVNKPPAASYRAPGGTNAVFAMESLVDELAEKLGLDPLEFRRINAVKEGDLRPNGVALPKIGLLEVLDAAQAHPHYSAPLGGPNRGRGLALGGWPNATGSSSVSANVLPDGTVSLVVGSVDITGTRQTLAMQLADTLGLPLADVHTTVADTEMVAYTDGSWGSRTTFATGWAVIEAGRSLLAEMTRRAAELWQVPGESVSFAQGRFTVGGETLTFKELAVRLRRAGKPIMASATARPGGANFSFAAHIVDVEVDPETGKIQLLRYTAVQDVGKAIHPVYVEGQIQGGATQGIGWGLNEEYVYDAQGRLLNGSFLDYRIPTCLDLPMIDPVLVEVPNPGHPFGVRGVGEVPILPPAGAIANAVARAVGARVAVLPLSPGHVQEALWQKE